MDEFEFSGTDFETIYGNRFDAYSTSMGHYYDHCAKIPERMMHYGKILSDIASLQNSHFIVDELPEIESGVTNELDINCGAYYDPLSKKYFMNMGGLTPLGVFELVCHYFGRPEFFPSLGDSSLIPRVRLDAVEDFPFFQIMENKYLPVISDLGPREDQLKAFEVFCLLKGSTSIINYGTGKKHSASSYVQHVETLALNLQPLCSIRAKYTMLFSYLLNCFLWSHEMAHIFSGHLRYINERVNGTPSRLFCMPEDPTKMARWAEYNHSLDPNELLTIEIEADVVAFFTMAGICIGDLDDYLWGSHEEDDAPLGHLNRVFHETTGRERWQILLTLIVLLLNSLASRDVILSKKTNYKDIWLNSSHPRFSIRSFGIQDNLNKLAGSFEDYREDQAIMKNQINALYESEQGLNFAPASIKDEAIIEAHRRIVKANKGMFERAIKDRKKYKCNILNVYMACSGVSPFDSSPFGSEYKLVFDLFD